MKSFISSAVLGAALLAQSGAAASIRHQHLHARHSAAAAVPEKRSVQFISTTDTNALTAASIKIGANAAATEGAAVSVGTGGGAFVVEFNNQSPDDIIVIVWGGAAEAGAVGASFIGANAPFVTTTLQSNTTTYVSFDPTKVSGNAISGAWGALYPGQSLTEFSGQLDNTIGEYTFTTESVFSTTDVSRLINMNGNKMEIHNFASESEAHGSNAVAACSATMTKNAFVCADGATSCMVGQITGCVAGTPNTSCDASGMDGGCTGLTTAGGYIVTNFF